MVERAYDVILEPAEEGGFTAYMPGLRGCVSEGDTEEEALENAKDAIRTWLDAWDQVEKHKGSLARVVTIDR